MRYAPYVLLAGSGFAAAQIRDCRGGSPSPKHGSEDYFCGETKQLTFENFPKSGSWIASQDNTQVDGQCSGETVPWDNAIATFADDLALAIRGPLVLEELAVYYPTTPSKKRSAPEQPRGFGKHSGHGHLHRRMRHSHQHEERSQCDSNEKRDDDMVVATIDGQVVSWVNNYHPEATASPEAAPEAAAPGVMRLAVSHGSDSDNDSSSSSDSSDSLAGTPDTTAPAPGSSWIRSSYYRAMDGKLNNMTFLNNFGGGASGVFDTKMGLGLSYATANGDAAAASSEVLSRKPLASNVQVIIMTEDKCDGSCGWVRDPTMSYKGFAGGQKIFLMSFQMPDDGETSGSYANMPAIWFLHGSIVRFGQFNQCNGWPEAGELDIFEVLYPGDDRMGMTYHGKENEDGGSPDYFKRPFDAPMKAAVIFDDATGKVTATVLPDDADFDAGLDADTVEKWLKGVSDDDKSLFQILAN